MVLLLVGRRHTKIQDNRTREPISYQGKRMARGCTDRKAFGPDGAVSVRSVPAGKDAQAGKHAAGLRNLANRLHYPEVGQHANYGNSSTAHRTVAAISEDSAQEPGPYSGDAAHSLGVQHVGGTRTRTTKPYGTCFYPRCESTVASPTKHVNGRISKAVGGLR
jgi:hypothetical protein